MQKFDTDHSPWKLFVKRKFYFLHRSYLNIKKAKPPTVFFYPQLPNWKTAIHPMLLNLGVGLTDKPSDDFSIAIFWENRTFRRRREELEKLKGVRVINYHCTDVSKKRVEEVFEQVFGYNLKARQQSAGRLLRKSNFNGMHDGTIIQGPVQEKKEGFVYEKLLNNQVGPNLFEDLRIGYFNGIIPLVSPRFHTGNDRFGRVLNARVEKTEDYLSEEEIRLIRSFCTKLGFEYGDLDLIRDRNDQRLYIVDANPTPTIPSSSSMKPALRSLMIRKWAEGFKKAFLKEG